MRGHGQHPTLEHWHPNPFAAPPAAPMTGGSMMAGIDVLERAPKARRTLRTASDVRDVQCCAAPRSVYCMLRLSLAVENHDSPALPEMLALAGEQMTAQVRFPAAQAHRGGTGQLSLHEHHDECTGVLITSPHVVMIEISAAQPQVSRIS